MVKEFCLSSGPDSSSVCARILAQMEQGDIEEIIESQEFPLVSYALGKSVWLWYVTFYHDVAGISSWLY